MTVKIHINGFTLIEMIVAIAIISLVIVGGLFSLQTYRKYKFLTSIESIKIFLQTTKLLSTNSSKGEDWSIEFKLNKGELIQSCFNCKKEKFENVFHLPNGSQINIPNNIQKIIFEKNSGSTYINNLNQRSTNTIEITYTYMDFNSKIYIPPTGPIYYDKI